MCGGRCIARDLVGDDFVIGQAGERWVVNTLRVGGAGRVRMPRPGTVGDVYQDVRLYVGGEGEDLTPVASGRLARGTNEVEGADIVISEAEGAPWYENFSGGDFKIYQVEFRNLNLRVEGGKRYRFGAWGMGRGVGEKGECFPRVTMVRTQRRGSLPRMARTGNCCCLKQRGGTRKSTTRPARRGTRARI